MEDGQIDPVLQQMFKGSRFRPTGYEKIAASRIEQAAHDLHSTCAVAIRFDRCPACCAPATPLQPAPIIYERTPVEAEAKRSSKIGHR
ncbi:hypothetical protein TomMM35A_09960 [Sphingobium sp. TomMM35A]